MEMDRDWMGTDLIGAISLWQKRCEVSDEVSTGSGSRTDCAIVVELFFYEVLKRLTSYGTH